MESTPGRGTRFHVYFPVARIASPAETKPTKPAVRGEGTVLLVEDEARVADVGSQMLERLGYRVLTALDGGSAIDCFKKHQKEIDLVILDMIMPDMGGAEVYEHLRALQKGVKVLISSGYSRRGEAEIMLVKGCCGFIQKPYDLAQLGSVVRKAMMGKLRD